MMENFSGGNFWTVLAFLFRRFYGDGHHSFSGGDFWNVSALWIPLGLNILFLGRDRGFLTWLPECLAILLMAFRDEILDGSVFCINSGNLSLFRKKNGTNGKIKRKEKGKGKRTLETLDSVTIFWITGIWLRFLSNETTGSPTKTREHLLS
ncbi:hypothetical protein RIR_jg9107.t1 [Rhizophagus irregularis DAOM 181602=DAOM 197198]|nr:hypothetical protein RIR_jg9107.t1 [Rhizophagus irregularis DAOM 181602=DAOM 197198]